MAQLVDISDPLLLSTINEYELADVSEFDPISSRHEMIICFTLDTNINITYGPNGLPDSNHKNETT